MEKSTLTRVQGFNVYVKLRLQFWHNFIFCWARNVPERSLASKMGGYLALYCQNITVLYSWQLDLFMNGKIHLESIHCIKIVCNEHCIFLDNYVVRWYISLISENIRV